MRLVELVAELDGEKLHRTFSKEHILLGRAESNDLVLHDPRISSLHGQIVLRDGVFYYQDLQSTNGSMVESRGERFVVDGNRFKEHTLSDGDWLQLGDIKQPVSVAVRIFEGETEGEAPLESGKTILASRAISDFSLLSQQILDDKGMVRSLFKFQKEIHELDRPQDIYQHTALFLLNHMPNAEYVALHREESVLDKDWRQVYFTTKARDVTAELKDMDTLVADAWQQKRAILLDADQLIGARSAGSGARPLRTMIVAPLVQQERVIGFFEVGNTATANALDSGDLDFASVVSYILSAKVVNLKLMEVVREAEEKLKNENLYLRSQIRRKEAPYQLVGDSAPMMAIRRQIETVGPSELTVLIMGETGTGKELVARAIHDHSKRHNRIFAAVNCGTFSETLLESELFGHLKGSFTGAVENKKGLFEVADGGTLFLDEIGETPYSLQVKLLRALQEGEIMPVGATHPRKVDVRVICATNKELEKEVERGDFREDLYYRINTFPILVPPLRERPDDIARLSEHFLLQYSAEMDKRGATFSDACLTALRRCAFPGNVRQLRNEIQRAVLLAEPGEPIEIEHFSPTVVAKRASLSSPEVMIAGRSLKEIMEDYEIKVIRRALEEYDWNRSKTAQILGISRQAFMAKLSKYGIAPED
jgi:Nif-specific regulatory protein